MKRRVGGALLPVAIAVGLALAIRPGGRASDLIEFVGRFHILALHLPLGALFVVGAAEILTLSPKLRPRVDPAIGFSLAVLVGTSVLAFGLGLLLAHGGSYPPAVLARHRGYTLAAIVASAVGLVVWSVRAKAGGRTLHRIVLLATTALFTAGAHAGGSLTHGEDFLTRNAPPLLQRWLGREPARPADPSAATTKIAEPHVWSEVLLPALRARCGECHGPDKAKGGLRVDSLAALKKGGKLGPAIIAGQSDASPILKRMMLAPTHDEHMPPDGKPSLEPGEIELLRWWIDRGASEDLRVRDTLPPDAARLLLARSTVIASPPPAFSDSALSVPIPSTSAAPPSKPGGRSVYAAVIVPILAARCEGCHGASKQKGGFRVDSHASLLAGGRGGVAVVPREPARGTLLSRVHLALGDDEHMPPSGQPQLKPREIEAIAWWIEHGADTTTTIDALPPKLRVHPAVHVAAAPTIASAAPAMAAVAAPARYEGPERAVDLYRDVVAVVLQRRCGSCHSGEHASGDLRVDDVPAMIAGGVVIPGKDAESALVKRMLLPASDPDRMPPIKKAQPSDGEIEVIRTWIAAGARTDMRVGARTLPADVLRATADSAPPSTGSSAIAARQQPNAPSRGGCASCSVVGAEPERTDWLPLLSSAALAAAWLLRRKRRVPLCTTAARHYRSAP